MDNIATASYRSLGRRRFLRTVASATAALAVPGLLASTLNGCSSKPMTPEQREALRKDIESRPKRILRFEIGAPLDAAIAASSPGVFLSTGAANRSYVKRGIYLIDDLNDSLFPPSVYRDTTPMAGMGSFFSSEVRNGPIEVIYGLGREQFRLPLAWYVDGGLIAGHFKGVSAWTYLVPLSLDAALARIREMINDLLDNGWTPEYQGYPSVEEAAVQMRAAQVSLTPIDGLAIGSFRDSYGRAYCGLKIAQVSGLGGPSDGWGYGCKIGFGPTWPFRAQLETIAETARQQLRLKNHDADIYREQPDLFSYVPPEWVPADTKVSGEVELYDYLRQIRAAGLTRDLDPRWRK